MKEIFKVDNNYFYHVKWEDRSHIQRFKHSIILPKNTYSPWSEDEDFIETFKIIQNNTLVDIYRCYSLWSLSKQLKDIKLPMIEIGVWRGGTSYILAKNNPNNKVYLCDTFEGVVKATNEDTVYKGGEHSDTSEDIVNELLKDFTNTEIVKGIFPETATKEMEDSEFKLCHIDVDVYQSAKDIFEWVWSKIIVGGIVVFDDYGFAACEGITKLVNEIVQHHKDLIFSYNLCGHAIIVKTR